MRSFKQIAVLAATIALLAGSLGCASTVQIDSEPQGATVEVNGQRIGETPTSYTDTATVFASHRLTVSKDGYHPYQTDLRRDGDINVGAVIGGIVGVFGAFPLLALWLWVLDYPPHVQADLSAIENSAGGSSPGGYVRHDGDTMTVVLEPAIDVDTIEGYYQFPADSHRH